MSVNKKVVKDTIAVRKGEELNYELLGHCLKKELTFLSNEPLEVEQFSAGSSNLTYLVRIGEWEAVLRRAPLGPVNTKAHDMLREYKVLKEMHPVFPLAPKPYIFIEDSSIIGAPFYIMERRHGVLLEKVLPEVQDGNVKLFREVSDTMVDTLVSLHDIDYKKTGLINMTRPDGFLERQVHGWIGRYEKVKTEEITKIEQLKGWILSNMPISPPATIIHYDFHINNVMFTKDNLSQIAGVLDWEMSTVGDPLTDLASALVMWHEDSDPEFFKFHNNNSPITTRKGFMTRNEFIEAYSKKSGRDVSYMHYYMVFAYFKHIVIAQQLYYRWKNGQTNDERFSNLDQFVKLLNEWTLEQTLANN
ncbi:phosphotransferase family protein [Alkalihalobacterium alkalinitrilicum]|uniref:phosphotransferase family protein n=1 Tax=Alkalihalobacterium alkalinitrilicum TaxID=427920 RepID=UPI0009954995|nr:phosphotransferase family protein [Alkalihalobacterium alkalinitrilicum]